MAWLLQRLEWAVDNLLGKDEECILVLVIDPEKDVAVSLDALREKPVLTRDNLVIEDGFVTGAWHEGVPLEGSVWFEYDDTLHASCEELLTATGTLARDLAQTLKLPLEVCPQKALDIQTETAAFLISDEFGFVPIQDTFATAALRIEDCFAKLW
jgi:hypothetical protein